MINLETPEHTIPIIGPMRGHINIPATIPTALLDIKLATIIKVATKTEPIKSNVRWRVESTDSCISSMDMRSAILEMVRRDPREREKR
jgi:hypothetical protein